MSQHEVQRKLGRCLIRLQQYECLAKALVTAGKIEGPVSAIENIQAQRRAAAARQTLGQLVGTLTDATVVPVRPESASSAEDSKFANLTEAWVHMDFSLEVGGDKHTQIVTELSRLVELRNRLVHHFIQDHDIWTEQGCLSAQAQLDRSFEQIDQRYQELRTWAQSIIAAKQRLAAFAATKVFDNLIHGIGPDGAVDWSGSTIVLLLREAEARFARNGWALLADATKLIQAESPDHTPQRYGCQTWRQVLHESGLFSIRKEVIGNGRPNIIWFQSR
ncbi:hypothetical protein CJ010_03175 [Azoarcus sp. DD4]|uniref:OST-HTH/LOTUS domain-containing protein n=1 Tax=Azoarcus sp. DD4 TaxID=2027405 RepID=UPI001165B53B|nr:OST-HTH/LOTUS domain-containing protein [Azoarcus sp. DD4]QDF95618.1 hypothetical protein CJ010_03175 [Azoarcus sp. DD4]